MHLDKDRDTCVSHSAGSEWISSYPRNAKCFRTNLIRIRIKIEQPSETSFLKSTQRSNWNLTKFEITRTLWKERHYSNSIWRARTGGTFRHTCDRRSSSSLRTLPASGRARRCPNRCATRSSAARQSGRGGWRGRRGTEGERHVWRNTNTKSRAPRRKVARVTVRPMHDMRVALGDGAYDVACVRKYIDQLTVGRILGRFAEFTILLRRRACADDAPTRPFVLSLSLAFSSLTFFLRRAAQPPPQFRPYRVIQREPAIHDSRYVFPGGRIIILRRGLGRIRLSIRKRDFSPPNDWGRDTPE